MQIDLVTFIAQIINLVILVFLLKKFLYKPLLGMVEQRQAMINKEQEDTRKALLDAEQQKSLFKQRIDRLEDEKQSLIEQATCEAEELKKSLFEEVQKAVEESKKRWFENLEKEKKSYDIDLGRQVALEFNDFANKSLKSLASTSLQTQIEEKFETLFNVMNGTEKKALLKEAKKAKQVVLSYGMASEKTKTRKYIKDFFDGIDVLEIESPELICGISLRAGDKEITWNLSEYLDEFSRNLERSLTSV